MPTLKEPPSSILELLVANLSGVKARTVTFEGREFVVTNITMLVPGVLPGSEGPILYKKEDVVSNVQAWNFMPILYNHPHDGGSGRRPEIVEKYGIGFVFNSQADSSLKAEGWFDVTKCDAIDTRIVPSVLNGQKLEVSTGLFIDIDPTEGVYNGRDYSGIASRYRPDHLALLMDVPGACSVEDGCGVNNKKEPVVETPTTLLGRLAKLLGLTANEASHEDISNQLRGLILDKYGNEPDRYDVWIESVFTDYVVFSKDGKCWKIGYTTSSDGVTSLASGEATAVIKTTEYKPAPTINQTVEDIEMSGLNQEQRKVLVDSIITNCPCGTWKEEDRDVLTKLDDKSLTSVSKGVENSKKAKDFDAQLPLLEAARNGFQAGNDQYTLNEKGEWEKKAIKKEEPPVANTENKPIKLEDLPIELQEDIVFARNAKEKRKMELVARLVANHAEETKQERAKLLSKLSLNELEDRVRDLPAEAPKAKAEAFGNYEGAAMPVENVSRSTAPKEDEMLGVPAWNFNSN